MSLPDNFDIRYSEMDDLAFLQKYFARDGACNDFPFGMNEKDEALKNWIGFSKYKASLTGVVGGEVCAVGTLFLMPYRKVAHHCAFYLVVDPAWQGKGIGTSMVKNLLHLAKSRFRLESLQCEMYEPSKMLPILKQLGFMQVFRQENFAKIDGVGHARVVMEHYF